MKFPSTGSGSESVVELVETNDFPLLTGLPAEGMAGRRTAASVHWQ